MTATEIHPVAIVETGAQLGTGVRVGPYSVIGPHVRVDDGAELLSHVVVGGHTTVGDRCQLFSFACIGLKTQDLKYAGGTTHAEIGEGTVLREFTTAHTSTCDGEVTRIDRSCLIMAYCHVAHGCELGNEVIMANGVQLAGEVKVGDMVTVGGMSGVHLFCRIGTLAMVGGGTKVRQDCPPYMIIEGCEAQVVGLNTVGPRRRGVAAETRAALKEAFRLIYREGLNRSQALDRLQYEIPDVVEVRHLIAFFRQSARGMH